MMKKLLVALSLLASPAWAATVNQSGNVTANHIPYWVTNGAIGDGGTSADSPITSIGVTNNGGSGICVNSARSSSAGYNALCLAASTTGSATISLQNYGTAGAQALQFVINGTTYAFPGSLANITIGVTPVIGGVNADCLVVSAGAVGQQPCNVSAVTSLTGDVTGTGPGVTVTTLATVNSNVGTFGNGTTVPSITVNGKGLITAVSTSPVSVTVGSSVINSGSNNGILYNNGGVLGNLSTLASAVLSTSVGGVPSMSATLPSGLTIPTPTFTGTLTFPDAATWTNVGVSKMVALSTGSATIPSSGNINVSGQYQVNGSQIAASNLSNGTTGSGSIVLNTSPTITGTWAGAVTFSGANTYSGNSTFSAQAIHTGTSAPASAAGNTVIMGTIAAPTLTNTGQAFLYNTTVNGAVLEGDGSSFDVVIANKAGTAAMQLTTNTTVPVWPGLANGTCSAGLALDASNNMVKTSCPGAAASIQVGTTTVTSGSSGNIEFNNAGTLGEVTPQNGVAIVSTGLVGTETVNAQIGTTYAIANGDRGKLITGTNGTSQAYSIAQAGAAGSFAAGWYADLRNINASTNLVVTPTTSTINGASTFTLLPGQGTRIVSDGTNYQVPTLPTPMVHLETLTASSSASVSTSASWSGYQNIEFDFVNVVPATAGVNFLLQLNCGGVQSTSYLNSGFSSANGAALSFQTGTTAIFLNGGNSVGNTSTLGTNGSIKLFNPGSANLKVATGVVTAAVNGSVQANVAVLGGFWNGTTACTGAQFSMSAGNIASGSIRVYGLP